MYGDLKPSVANSCGNAHVKCQWRRKSDRDAGDGLVTHSASQVIAFYTSLNLEPTGRNEKENDRETHGYAI